MTELTAEIAKMLKTRGWSRSDLARKTGIAEGTVNKRLSENGSIRLREACAICNKLQFGLEILADGNIVIKQGDTIIKMTTE